MDVESMFSTHAVAKGVNLSQNFFFEFAHSIGIG